MYENGKSFGLMKHPSLIYSAALTFSISEQKRIWNAMGYQNDRNDRAYFGQVFELIFDEVIQFFRNKKYTTVQKLLNHL